MLNHWYEDSWETHLKTYTWSFASILPCTLHARLWVTPVSEAWRANLHRMPRWEVSSGRSSLKWASKRCLPITMWKAASGILMPCSSLNSTQLGMLMTPSSSLVSVSSSGASAENIKTTSSLQNYQLSFTLESWAKKRCMNLLALLLKLQKLLWASIFTGRRKLEHRAVPSRTVNLISCN